MLTLRHADLRPLADLGSGRHHTAAASGTRKHATPKTPLERKAGNESVSTWHPFLATMSMIKRTWTSLGRLMLVDHGRAKCTRSAWCYRHLMRSWALVQSMCRTCCCDASGPAVVLGNSEIPHCRAMSRDARLDFVVPIPGRYHEHALLRREVREKIYKATSFEGRH